MLLTKHPNRNQSSAPKLEKREFFSPYLQQGTTALKDTRQQIQQEYYSSFKKIQTATKWAEIFHATSIYSQPPNSVLLQRAPMSALSVSLGWLIMMRKKEKKRNKIKLEQNFSVITYSQKICFSAMTSKRNKTGKWSQRNRIESFTMVWEENHFQKGSQL